MDSHPQHQHHTQVKYDLRSIGGKVRQVATQTVAFRVENNAAAGGDHIRLQIQEIANLHKGFQQQQGGDDQQEPVLDANQRVVFGAVVSVVDDKPDAAEDKIHHLEEQRRVAVVVHGQGTRRAHGADEKRVNPVRGIDKQAQRQELENQQVGQDSGNQIGLALERQLPFRPVLRSHQRMICAPMTEA